MSCNPTLLLQKPLSAQQVAPETTIAELAADYISIGKPWVLFGQSLMLASYRDLGASSVRLTCLLSWDSDFGQVSRLGMQFSRLVC